jgi:signal peptidase I
MNEEKNTPDESKAVPQNDKKGFWAPLRESVWEFIKFFIIAAAIVLPIRLWVAQPFIVSGSSMLPTFENGEYLIINEFSYHFREPARGEVIIFRYPQDTSKFFIKRIIGLPGERLVIKNSEINIYNKDYPGGMTISESYLPQNIKMADMQLDLSDKEYFVLGDNRPASSDSRFWGPLNEKFVIGKVWLRLWPFEKISVFP